MAFGDHWEWRGFGLATPALRARVAALPALLPGEWRLVDRYLWTPACTANLKLREGAVKFKRRLETDGDLERWREDPAEVFPFPLNPGVVARLEEALGLAPAPPPAQALGEAELLARLGVPVIAVAKVRRLHQLDLPAFAQPVGVELTDIEEPEPLATVALEHGERAAVQAAMAHLGLPTEGLHPANYLEILRRWGPI